MSPYNIWSIKKDSEEEKNFITSLIHGVKNLNTSVIRSKENVREPLRGDHP